MINVNNMLFSKSKFNYILLFDYIYDIYFILIIVKHKLCGPQN